MTAPLLRPDRTLATPSLKNKYIYTYIYLKKNRFFRHFGRWGLGRASQPLRGINLGRFLPQERLFPKQHQKDRSGSGDLHSSIDAGVLLSFKLWFPPHLN